MIVEDDCVNMIISSMLALVVWIGEGAYSIGIGGGKESPSWAWEGIARASEENKKLELNGVIFK